MNLFLIALGGALGAVSRYALDNAVSAAVARRLPDFPLGTLIINILGCFLIGLLFPILCPPTSPSQSNPLKALLLTGVLGGFTTFSAFGLQSLQLLHKNQYAAAVAYIAASLALGLAATALGALAANALGYKLVT